MPAFIPTKETSTLVVALGYAFQGSFTAGSPNLQGIGFTFTAADVGDVIFVLSGGPDGLTDVTWTTVLSFTDSTHVVLNANLPDNSVANVNCVLYRPLTGKTNYPLSGSVSVDLSLTQHSSAQFTIVSLDGSLIPPIGMPVLITDTEAAVEYFGGPIDQLKAYNEPGAFPLVYTECQCTGWEILCRRRRTGVSDALAENDPTLGVANPQAGQFVNVRPDQIITYWVTHAMFDDGVTTSLDTTGPQLPTFSSVDAKISDALDQLVNASTPVSGTPQYQWFMSPRRVLNFVKQGTLSAPFNISDADLSDQNFLIQVENTISLQNYFNRGLAEITQVQQTFIGDGVSTSFTLAQAVPLSALGQVRVTLNGGTQNVGQSGVDIGKEWYYTVGSKTITQIGSATSWANNVRYAFNDVVTSGGILYASLQSNNLNHTPASSPTFWKPWGANGPLQSTDVLVVSFPVFEVFAYDAAAAQSALQAAQSGSGLWEEKINLNALNSVVDAESFVTSMVLVAKDPAQTVAVKTYRPGLNIGQTIQVNLADIGVNSQGSPALGVFMIIDSVKITTSNNRKLFTVTASLDAPLVGGPYAQLRRGMGTAGGVNAHPLSIPLSGAATGISSGLVVPPGTTGGAGQWVVEIPAGVQDGVNATFTLSLPPAPAIGFPGKKPVIWVFVNGVALDPFSFIGSPAVAEFSVTAGKTLTLNTPPKPSDTFWVQYLTTGGGATSNLVFPLYGTGLNKDYSLAAISTIEQNWALTASALAGAKLFVATVPNFWHANLSDAQWISPNNVANATPGAYVYQQQFSLAGFDPSTAVIQANIMTDDVHVIQLNGVTVFTSAASQNTPFPVTINTNFVGGINTLKITGTETVAAPPNPTGFLLEIVSTFAKHL